jgi:uroporphyrinogen decarboxylase
MDSREIVRRTLEFTGPERVAVSFPPSDFVFASPLIPNPQGEWRRTGEQAWERTDEWGNLWRRLDPTSKGEVVCGALQDLEEVGTFSLPDFSNPDYYAGARRAFSDQPDRWHIGSIQGFTFSVARKLMGMEAYLMALALERTRIGLLHERVDEQVRVQIEQMRAAGADCIMIAEDWGAQTRLLISPRLWRQEFKPRFTALCACAHTAGLWVFMHSCGKMTDIIPDLIEAGVDLLQFDQPRIHGIDLLQKFQAGARITFWCPVDIQTTLQSKDERSIRREARELVEKLWCGRGGFVAGYYTDEPSVGLEPTWQQIASDEFMQQGRRERFLR